MLDMFKSYITCQRVIRCSGVYTFAAGYMLVCSWVVENVQILPNKHFFKIFW